MSMETASAFDAQPQTAITVLFTDIEGSTRLWENDGARMSVALARHDELARSAVELHRGVVVKMTGDGMCAAFPDARDALDAVVMLQVILLDPGRTHGIPLSVRCGLHAGVVERRNDDFFGPSVNRTARIMSAAHGGQVLLSQSVVDSIGATLPDPVSLRDLGIVRLKDLATPEHVYQLLHPALRQSFPALRSLEATPNNLPQQVTSFVGREREVAEIAKLFDACRLLTLSGFGGIGKTRLALQVAADLSGKFADGVWLVELASVSDPTLVPQALASAVGVKEGAGRSVVDALVSYVVDRQVLLILDNCEHLTQSCAELARSLLREGRSLKVLATSREPLRVAGETLYQVATLAVPSLASRPTIEDLAQFEAIRLFCDRARSAQHDFRMTRENSVAIHAICHRLAGIPLAIELAAARVRALSVEAIDARLSDLFRLLTGGDRGALPRQQTLRASIDWSYDLLSDPEKALLQRMSVFVGGFTLEAAEAVGSGEAEVDQADVLDLLCRLVEKSLVALDADGRRYRMLESVRHYAQEKAGASDRNFEARARHLSFYASFAEKARAGLFGPAQSEWLLQLDNDRENLLAAHAAYEDVGQGSDVDFRLVDALKNYWTMRGLLALGHRVTLEMLAQPRLQARDSIRGRGLFDAGWISYCMGRHAEAQQYLEESVAIARETNNMKGLAPPLQPLGLACLAQGNIGAARQYLDEALDLAERFGNHRDVSAALVQLAQLHRSERNHELADSLYRRALDIAKERGDTESSAVISLNLSMVAIDQACPERARTMLLDVFRIVDERESKPLAQSLLDVCAGLASSIGEWTKAAFFYGAAEAVARDTGQQREFSDEAFLRPLIDRARDALGADAFAEAEEIGADRDFKTQMRDTCAWLLQTV